MKTLIQISDCHLFADKTKTGYVGINPYESLGQVLEEVKVLEPDVVLVTGDISGDGSQQSYEHFQQLWDRCGINAQLLCLAGNHDSKSDWPTNWHSPTDVHCVTLSQDWYCHLIPATFIGASAELAEASIAELSRSVQSNANVNHVIAIHHPLHISDVWMDKHNLENANALISMLSEFKQIKAVLHGHVHTARRVDHGHWSAYACPSTCWQWGNTPEFSVSTERSGFAVIKLFPDRSIEYEVRRV